MAELSVLSADEVPIDTDADVVRALGVDPDRPYALFVGRITRQKGLMHLLAAAEQLPPEAGLVLCAGAADTPAERQQVGLLALVPAIADAVSLPVVATGGIADGRGVAAAIALGASAAQIGTGFLRCPEAKLHPAWADALATTAPEDTMVTRAFSGRAGRSIATDYVRAATALDAPVAAPYPVQRALTGAMRAAGQKDGDVNRMQVWAGQAAALAKAAPAGELAQRIWEQAQAILA